MTSCPHSEYDLMLFDSVTNPMGEACNRCEDHDCEHNPNPDPNAPFDGWEDPMDSANSANSRGDATH